MTTLNIHYLTLPGSDVTYQLRSDSIFYHNNTPVPHLTFTDAPDSVLISNPYAGEGQKSRIMLDRGLLILYACKRFHLPIHLWDKVEVQFLDRDTKNYDPENLYVLFKEKIPYSELKEFYYVPGNELNAINEEGVLLSIPSGRLRRPKITEDTRAENRYVYCSADARAGKVVTRVLHRLLALTFNDPPADYPNLVVDHLNAVKYDFRLENLEWVSVAENNDRARAFGLRTDNKMVEVFDTFSSEVTTHLSSNVAAAYVGCSPGIMSSAFTADARVIKKRWKVRYVGEEVSWDDITIKPSGNSEVKTIKAKHAITGTIVEFESIRDAIRQLGLAGIAVHQPSIVRQVNNVAEKRITGGYEFKYKTDNTPWFEFTKWDKEVFTRGLDTRTAVYNVVDVTTGEGTIYFGWEPIAALMKIGKRAVIMIASEGGTVNRKYKIVKLR